MEYIENLIKKIISENDLNAKIDQIDTEDDGYCSVYIDVDRKDFRKAKDLDINILDCYIFWRQSTPELIHAEVGDFVSIFDKTTSDDLSEVGIVSSKFLVGDKIAYGCRYIKLTLKTNHYYDFELTDEIYGGYHTGFLEILTAQQLNNHLNHQLQIELNESIKRLEAKFKHSTKNVSSFVECLNNCNKIKCEKLDLTTVNNFREANVVNFRIV